MYGRNMSELDYELLLQEAAEQISLAHPSGIDLLLNNAGMQEPITRASETYASTCPVCNLDQLAADLFSTSSCMLCCTLKTSISQYMRFARCRAGSEYVHVLTTNVVGPYLTTKHLLPSLMKKKTRVIVNTSSLYDSINATLNDSNGHHSPTGSVLLASNTSKAAVNMRKPCTFCLGCYSLYCLSPPH